MYNPKGYRTKGKATNAAVENGAGCFEVYRGTDDRWHVWVQAGPGATPDRPVEFLDWY